jgi:hypothetical protein
VTQISRNFQLHHKSRTNNREDDFPSNRRRLMAALTGLLVVFSSTGLWAEPPGPTARRRVLLLAEKSGDPFIGRIKAEIASLGIDVIVHPPVGSLEADARAEHASAAIRMLPSRKGVEVWMADETSGRSLLRQVIVDETPAGPDQNLIALQTAELLRTSFFPKSLEPQAQPPSPAPPAPPPPPSPSPMVQASGESGVQAGVGLLHGVGGASSSLQGWLSLQHRWGRHFGIALDFSGPFSRGTVSGPEGQADVGAMLVGGEALVRLPSENDRVAVTAGLGGALAVLVAKGHPSDQGKHQLLVSSTTAYAGAVYLHVAGQWRPAEWLGVGLMGLVGTTTTPVKITFAGNDAGTWGVPFFGGLLLAEVDWR